MSQVITEPKISKVQQVRELLDEIEKETREVVSEYMRDNSRDYERILELEKQVKDTEELDSITIEEMLSVLEDQKTEITRLKVENADLVNQDNAKSFWSFVIGAGCGIFTGYMLVVIIFLFT